MFGGTPSNLSISVMNRPNVEVLAGINLPMLVKLAKVRPDDIRSKSAVAAAQEAGAQVHHRRQPGARRQMSDAAAITRIMNIVNEKGLHARASAKFVQLVEKYDAKVQVSRAGETVGGDSIMGLMMLAAGSAPRSP